MLLVFLTTPMFALCWLSSNSRRTYWLNFREIFRRKFRYVIAPTAKVVLGEISIWRNFCSGKILFCENSVRRKFLRWKFLRRKFLWQKFLAPTERKGLRRESGERCSCWYLALITSRQLRYTRGERCSFRYLALITSCHLRHASGRGCSFWYFALITSYQR